MTPTSSSTTKNLPCSPVSSNCVLWEGPDLPCIKLCKGDTISDVQYKAALVLCELKKELDLTDLDLKSIFDICSACPDPKKTLHTILQALINKIAEIEKAIDNVGQGGTVEEAVVKIASCFRTTDGSGDIITELKHSDYTKLIGANVCEVLTEMNGLVSRVETLEENVGDLQNRVKTLEHGDDGLSKLADRVQDLEDGAKNLTDVLGTTTDLATVLSEEPTGTGPQGAVMSLADRNTALFTGTSKTVSDSLKHLLLIAYDLRSAVKIIQDNCCKISCDDIVVDFDIRLSDDRLQASLFFNFKSHVPAGFSDVNALGNKLTITDARGAQAEFLIKIADAVNSADPIRLDFSDTAIDPALDYTFTMDCALKSETLTCVKCINKSVTYKDTCAYCEISVTGAGSSDGSLIIIYEEEIPT
jgi:hypothetical protein